MQCYATGPLNGKAAAGWAQGFQTGEEGTSVEKQRLRSAAAQPRRLTRLLCLGSSCAASAGATPRPGSSSSARAARLLSNRNPQIGSRV